MPLTIFTDEIPLKATRGVLPDFFFLCFFFFFVTTTTLTTSTSDNSLTVD